MRDFWIILVIVISIVCGSHYSYNLYQDLYDFYQKNLESLIDTIDVDQDKETTILKMEEDWKKREKVLIILQDHASMDQIEENLYECFHYYRMKDVERLILSKDKTLSGMEDLRKREELLLVDIL